MRGSACISVPSWPSLRGPKPMRIGCGSTPSWRSSSGRASPPFHDYLGHRECRLRCRDRARSEAARRSLEGFCARLRRVGRRQHLLSRGAERCAFGRVRVRILGRRSGRLVGAGHGALLGTSLGPGSRTHGQVREEGDDAGCRLGRPGHGAWLSARGMPTTEWSTRTHGVNARKGSFDHVSGKIQRAHRREMLRSRGRRAALIQARSDTSQRVDTRYFDARKLPRAGKARSRAEHEWRRARAGTVLHQGLDVVRRVERVGVRRGEHLDREPLSLVAPLVATYRLSCEMTMLCSSSIPCCRSDLAPGRRRCAR